MEGKHNGVCSRRVAACIRARQSQLRTDANFDRFTERLLLSPLNPTIVSALTQQSHVLIVSRYTLRRTSTTRLFGLQLHLAPEDGRLWLTRRLQDDRRRRSMHK
jgi:hypothetical protein